MNNKPIRHHTVPKFYLAGFAAGTKLSAVETRTGRSFATNIADATTENHFYSMPDHPTNPSLFEEELGLVETAASPILASISEGHWPLAAAERDQFAEFLTLQFLRGQDHRTQIHGVLASDFRRLAAEDPAEFVRIAELPGAPPGLIDLKGELPGLVTAAIHIHQIATLMPKLVPYFLGRRWSLVRFDSPSLLTSDAPITPVPDPELDQSVGLGLENADAMLFPLTRCAGLYMKAPGVVALLPGGAEEIAIGGLDSVMTGDQSLRTLFNDNTTMHAHHRVYHHPEDAALVPKEVQRLSLLGGRIDFENPPAGLRPAP